MFNLALPNLVTHRLITILIYSHSHIVRSALTLTLQASHRKMRFSHLIVQAVCFTSTALALPVQNGAGDVTIISRSLQDVTVALTRLTNTVKGIDKRASSQDLQRKWNQVVGDARALSELLWRDGRTIRTAPMVGLLEAATLLSPIQNIQTLTNTLADSWVAIKVGLTPVDKSNVQRILLDHQAAAKEYADAILTRESGIASPIAQALGTQMQTTIQRAVNAYRM